MAMSRSCMILRRAFSTVAPRALRPVSSPRILSAAAVKMDISSYNNSHHFCTDAKKINLLDQKLIKALKSRISPHDRLAVTEAMPPVPAGFPFAIEDVHYYNSIKLKRELDDGEIIDVEVDLPDSVKYTHTIGDTVPTVRLRVNILKKTGNGLKFNVSATFDGIRVTHVTVTEPDPDDSEFPTRFGPYTLEEGSDLQSSLGEFIEKKGVEKKYVEFLYNYLFKNDNRRDVLMVDKMEKFFDE